MSPCIGHDALQPLIPTNPASDLLAKDPHRNGQEADEEEQAAEDAEDGQHSILVQPVVDKVGETKGEEIAGIDGDEDLLAEFGVAIDDVAKDTSGGKGHGHVGEAKGQDGTGPMGLIVDGGAEAEEADGAQEDDDDHHGQAELGLVDAAVLLGQPDADPVVQRTRDHFADHGHDERAQADQARLRDAKVVGRVDEDDGVDDGVNHDPGDGGAEEQEPPEDGRVEEEEERTDEDAEERRVAICAVVDLEGAPVGRPLRGMFELDGRGLFVVVPVDFSRRSGRRLVGRRWG